MTIGLEQAELITLSAFNNVCTLAFAVRSCSFKGRQNDSILDGYGWGVTQTYTCTNYEERVATNNILHPLDII